MREKVLEALIEMGASIQTKGCQYIADAVVLIDSGDIKYAGVMDVYKGVAEKNETSVSRVERVIRNTFSHIISKGNIDAVEKYLSLQNTTSGNLLHVLRYRLSKQ